MSDIKNNNMNPSYLGKHKWLHLCFGFAAVSGILIYLWWLRYSLSYDELFIPLLGFMVLVNGFSREGVSKIGLWPQDFIKCFRERTRQLFALSALLSWWIIFSGNAANLTRHRGFWFLGGYIFSGLVQQYMLNGFFVNRLIGFYGNQDNKNIPIIAAAVFSLIHTPNWFLMLATGLGGYFCVKIFLEHKNLYFLGLAHGLVAFLLFHSFPKWVTHHFVIGIKYFSVN